jgi:hypothetical protein
MPRHAPIDDEFLRGCLEEVRGGEFVTIQTKSSTQDVRAALVRLGATSVDFALMEIVRYR